MELSEICIMWNLFLPRLTGDLCSHRHRLKSSHPAAHTGGRQGGEGTERNS